ncbi:MAG: imelysin family protein [Nannocystis sp.]|nr:imelysin family protein [Nannocystis sp.]MBA3547088.1 imelysin family protein [Nannocystis sp.]
MSAGCITTDGEVLRREVLAHLADEVFVPAHARLQVDAAALASATTKLCETDGADPKSAKTAWLATRSAWNVTGAFAFGPVIEQMQAGPLDFWPVRMDTIEAKILEAPAAIDAAWIDGLGTSAKGLPALEYLLFAQPLPANTPRCAYATALAGDISRRSDELGSGWLTHAEHLRTAGTAGSAYASEQAGLDAVVNATIENLYRMVKDKLDRPLGNLTGSDPDPAALESRFSGTTRDDLEANLRGFAMVYLGADGESGGEPGLGALVASRDPDLDQRILAQHGVARDALAGIPDPFATALTDHRSDVQRARDEIDGLRRLIKLDVASLLGVTLSLSDNDGD